MYTNNGIEEQNWKQLLEVVSDSFFGQRSLETFGKIVWIRII